MTSLETALLAVVGVGLLAWLLRALSGGRRNEDVLSGRHGWPEAPAEPPWPAEEDLTEDREEEQESGIAVVTSDGWSIVPRGHGVHVMQPPDPDVDVAPACCGRPGWRPGETLSAGDLVAARILRGAPDYDPWRLEALGRDREFRAWRFETEEAARSALEIMEQRVVRKPLGPDGEPQEFTDGDFAQARHIEEMTEQELAMMPEDEPEEET